MAPLLYPFFFSSSPNTVGAHTQPYEPFTAPTVTAINCAEYRRGNSVSRITPNLRGVLRERFTHQFLRRAHLGRSTPHPKTDLSKNQVASRLIILWPQVYKNVIFRNKINIPRRFWDKWPPHSENIIAETCYLYRRTRPNAIPPKNAWFSPGSPPRSPGSG